MAYVDSYTLGEDATFQHRCQVALADIAGNLLVSGTPTSGDRAAAQRILDDLPASAIKIARIVVVHPTVSATAPTGNGLTDAQLKTSISAIIGSLVR